MLSAFPESDFLYSKKKKKKKVLKALDQKLFTSFISTPDIMHKSSKTALLTREYISGKDLSGSDCETIETHLYNAILVSIYFLTFHYCILPPKHINNIKHYLKYCLSSITDFQLYLLFIVCLARSDQTCVLKTTQLWVLVILSYTHFLRKHIISDLLCFATRGHSLNSCRY